jgi:isoquinoline 1-oxidoreductase beta subunit
MGRVAIPRQRSDTAGVCPVDRREFLRAGALGAGGLLLGFSLPRTLRAAARGAATTSALSAWIHIGSDEAVTLFIHKAEMGQGTVTSLSMLLAEELECDWTRVRTEFPGLDPAYGSSQGVYGSASIRTSWIPLRRAGATARQMLVNAAAAEWHVDAGQCRAENGVVVNTASGARLTYGALADAASKLPVPDAPALKSPSDFALLGKPVKRLDTPSKVNGTAMFGIDVRLPGMLYAVVARCPVFGGAVATVDDAKARLVPGVKRIVRVSSGVAVVADNTWSAMEGRRALEVTWDEGPTAAMSSDGLMKMCADLVEQPGVSAKAVGDVTSALAHAAKIINAVYQVPFLAHAPMEPLNCTARVGPDSCEVWASTQGQTAARQAAMAATGLRQDQVTVHTLYMGGGFGRRTNADYIGEAVEIAKAAGAPVKLTWSRPDDTKHDRYRPASYVKLAGGVDADGWPVAFSAKVACPQFSGAGTAVEGLSTLVYAIPNLSVESHNANTGIPTHFWRSVGYSQNTFFAESFVDQLAALGGKDPLDLRRRLLADQPRLLAALNLAADKAGWRTPAPAGRARGLSVVNNVGSYTAQVAEVSLAADKVIVHRVVCAVDCGMVVNPAIVRQQIQSGVIFGLSAALKGAITIDRGRVNESSFSDYDVIRMPEAPVIDVHIVPSTAAPGGIGEASVPGIAPAVANALFALTKKRVRQLPIQATDLV